MDFKANDFYLNIYIFLAGLSKTCILSYNIVALKFKFDSQK